MAEARDGKTLRVPSRNVGISEESAGQTARGSSSQATKHAFRKPANHQSTVTANRCACSHPGKSHQNYPISQ